MFDFSIAPGVETIIVAVAEFSRRAPPRESFRTAAEERKNYSIIVPVAEFPGLPPSPFRWTRNDTKSADLLKHRAVKRPSLAPTLVWIF